MNNDEARYRDSESKLLDRWNATSPDDLAKKQNNNFLVPGWLNAPEWAEWLGFCSARGWIFVSKKPHEFRDGVLHVHGETWARACDIPGVTFFSNAKGYSGEAAPHWVADRRAAIAKATGSGS